MKKIIVILILITSFSFSQNSDKIIFSADAIVSHATLASGSNDKIESKTPSEIQSQTLSGCPSVTDSDVKKNSL